MTIRDLLDLNAGLSDDYIEITDEENETILKADKIENLNPNWLDFSIIEFRCYPMRLYTFSAGVSSVCFDIAIDTNTKVVQYKKHIDEFLES